MNTPPSSPPPRDADRHEEPTALHDMSRELADRDGPTTGWGRAGLSEVLGGRYQLREMIGRGGMADVFRAYDELLDRDVAVKVLREDGEGDRGRFVREAKTLAALSHSAIVSMLDAGLQDETPYLVMDLVDGTTLSTHLDEPLDPKRAAEIGSAAAAALAYAHDRGVVHRDVKPGNLLIRDDGKVLLADFGIARMAGEMTNHTNTGAVIGSVHYLAPEQVASQEITPAADVYALGMLLLRALTGRHAFEGTNVEAAVARLTTDPDIPADLDPIWQDLLQEMTAREPERRPTAEQVSERLAALAAYDATPTALMTAVVPTVAAANQGFFSSAKWHSGAARTGLVPAAAAAVVLAVMLTVAALSPDGSTDNRTPTATAVATDVDPQNVVSGRLLTYTGADLAPVSATARESVVTRSKATAKPAKANKAKKDKAKKSKGKSKGKGKGKKKR